MGKDSDLRPDAENDYQFMKETIKERPREVRRILGKAAAFMAGGALFGICAAATFYWTGPSIGQRFGNRGEDVKLATPTPGQPAESRQVIKEGEGSAAVAEDSAFGGTEVNLVFEDDPLMEYEEFYSNALEVSREPRKAIVTVSGVYEAKDLLDASVMSYGDTEGIIFLENASSIYILTECEEIEEAEHLQIAFVDGSTAAGILCKTDPRTGLAVVQVPLSEISRETRENISVVTLGNSYSLQQAKPVIAIGSPTGDKDGVLYGVVTAVSSKVSVADAEYNLMTTDMIGSQEGNGVLLDTNGEVIGVITNKGEGESNIIRALSVAQLRLLLETMSNCDAIKYLGIYGVTITDSQAKSLGIPKGIYVNNVDNHSPAMEAGIQRGDIITSLAGRTVRNMQAYTGCLQQQETGSRVNITVSRQNAEEGYVEMDFEVIIEER